MNLYELIENHAAVGINASAPRYEGHRVASIHVARVGGLGNNEPRASARRHSQGTYPMKTKSSVKAPTTTPAPTQPLFQTRPFANMQQAKADSLPDSTTQSEQRQPLGHSFSRIQMTEPRPPARLHFPAIRRIGSKHDEAAQANRTGLPDSLKTGIENLSGMPMDDVRVHLNSAKPTQLQALAYTQGTNIHVAPGQERHLAQEAWHVVQPKLRLGPASL